MLVAVVQLTSASNWYAVAVVASGRLPLTLIVPRLVVLDTMLARPGAGCDASEYAVPYFFSVICRVIESVPLKPSFAQVGVLFA